MKISLLPGMVVAAFGRMACDKGDNASMPDGTPPYLLAGTCEGYTDAGCSYFQDRHTDGESMTLTARDDGNHLLGRPVARSRWVFK